MIRQNNEAKPKILARPRIPAGMEPVIQGQGAGDSDYSTTTWLNQDRIPRFGMILCHLVHDSSLSVSQSVQNRQIHFRPSGKETIHITQGGSGGEGKKVLGVLAKPVRR